MVEEMAGADYCRINVLTDGFALLKIIVNIQEATKSNIMTSM